MTSRSSSALQATQVAIVGAGPAGLLLGAWLGREGVDHVVVEKHSAAHVLERVRAGILEPATVALLHELGAGARLAREGLPHDGLFLSVAGARHHIDLQALTGRHVTVYGQTELTRDLMAQRDAAGWPTLYEADDVALDGLTDSPRVRFKQAGRRVELRADWVAGC
ncbi:MAG: FAD-dependent monooxygenase, partial [Burkholderiales bacterium]|nr:FAD-dependent monooxygenase [Burkholderiales bacterium]